MNDRSETFTPDDRSPDRLTMGHVSASPTIGKIAAAIAKAQSEFGTVTRDSTADIQGRDGKRGYSYTYATLADSIAAVTKALTENEIALIQPTTSSRGAITVTTILAHGSGEWISSDLSMPVADAKAQAVGSAISYARRYALQAFVGIAPEDDDGAAAQANPPPDEPRAGSRKVTTPKGNGNGGSKKPPTEPKTRPKKNDSEESESAQKVRDALADYRKASGDGDTNARVLLARALGKPWPEKPSEMDMTVAVAGFSTMADAAEKKTGDGEPAPYDPGDHPNDPEFEGDIDPNIGDR